MTLLQMLRDRDPAVSVSPQKVIVRVTRDDGRRYVAALRRGRFGKVVSLVQEMKFRHLTDDEINTLLGPAEDRGWLLVQILNLLPGGQSSVRPASALTQRASF